MNEFVSWCRNLLVSFLFHAVTSLHPPSFHRNYFSTLLYSYCITRLDQCCSYYIILSADDLCQHLLVNHNDYFCWYLSVLLYDL